jgi:hypothetical protein
MKPRTKSILIIIILAMSFLSSIFLSKTFSSYAFPISIFYILLAINTYFSVDFFAKIIPETLNQKIIDFVLIIFYIVMIFQINKPLYFSVILSLFFVVATIKYIDLLGILPQPKLLKRKIMADCLGGVLGLITLIGIIFGYIMLSLWFLVIVFAIANIYLFFINPLYRLDD